MSRSSSSRDLQDALGQLLGRGEGWKPFDPKQPVGGRVGGIGTGTPSDGSGVSGSFTELDASRREYYADRVLATTDGVFTSVERHIKSILLVGGERATFEEPPA